MPALAGKNAKRLEKVGDGGAGRHRLLGLWDLVEEEEVAMEGFVELEYGRHVAAAVAVVGRRPYRDQVLLREHVLETLLHQLVCPAHEL